MPEGNLPDAVMTAQRRIAKRQPRCDLCGKEAPETTNKHARGFPWTAHRCVACCESGAFGSWENFDRALNGRWGHLPPDDWRGERFHEPRFDADGAQRWGD